MSISLFNQNQSVEVVELFTQVFKESANESEGEVIGELVSDLISTIEEQNLLGFTSSLNKRIIGCIFFSRLLTPSKKIAFILSPVAIATDFQGKGYGQKLINFGIEYLRSLHIDLIFTYGDPNFYSKVGFKQISENLVKAPFTLTYPEGWLAQSLNGKVIEKMEGTVQCVDALNNPKYW